MMTMWRATDLIIDWAAGEAGAVLCSWGGDCDSFFIVSMTYSEGCKLVNLGGSHALEIQNNIYPHPHDKKYTPALQLCRMKDL